MLIDPGLDPTQAADLQYAFDQLQQFWPGLGLGLFVFDVEGPRTSCISNCPSEQTLAAVKAWVARQDARDAGG